MKRINTQHTCDDCAKGHYDMKFLNLSIKGEPTLIICEPHPWPKHLRSEPQCESFQLKNLITPKN